MRQLITIPGQISGLSTMFSIRIGTGLTVPLVLKLCQGDKITGHGERALTPRKVSHLIYCVAELQGSL